jgi:hypothetical protein
MTRAKTQGAEDGTLIAPDVLSSQECNGKGGLYMAGQYPKVNRM